MKVAIHCQGCAGKVRKHISKMEGTYVHASPYIYSYMYTSYSIHTYTYTY